MSAEVLAPNADYEAEVDQVLEEVLGRRPKTPLKGSNSADAWQSCYELTEVMAVMYPSTMRIPYPFALPRQVRPTSSKCPLCIPLPRSRSNVCFWLAFEWQVLR